MERAKAPIEWEPHRISTHAVTPGGDLISKEALDSVKRNRLGLKGPLATPIGKGHKSLNLTLRKALQLYANVRPCKSIDGCVACGCLSASCPPPSRCYHCSSSYGTVFLRTMRLQLQDEV
jgi:isocitrate/isopropylmalate dehydrogenase